MADLSLFMDFIARNFTKKTFAEIEAEAAALGKSGQKSGDKFSSGISKGFNKVDKRINKTVLLASGAAALIGAALPAAIIGGFGLGFLALGGLILKSNPAVKSAFTQLANTAKSVFKTASQPLVAPIITAFGQIGTFIKGNFANQLKAIFTALAPSITPLTTDLLTLVSTVMPSLISMATSFTKVVKDPAFQAALTGMAKNIAKFLQTIANNPKSAVTFMKDLGKAVGVLVDVLDFFVKHPHVAEAILGIALGIKAISFTANAIQGLKLLLALGKSKPTVSVPTGGGGSLPTPGVGGAGKDAEKEGEKSGKGFLKGFAKWIGGGVLGSTVTEALAGISVGAVTGVGAAIASAVATGFVAYKWGNKIDAHLKSMFGGVGGDIAQAIIGPIYLAFDHLDFVKSDLAKYGDAFKHLGINIKNWAVDTWNFTGKAKTAVDNFGKSVGSTVVTGVKKGAAAVFDFGKKLLGIKNPKPVNIKTNAAAQETSIHDLQGRINALHGHTAVISVTGFISSSARAAVAFFNKNRGSLKKVGLNAGGTSNWRGGWSWVGEKGPELLNLPRGSKVIPNGKSKAMANSGGAVSANSGGGKQTIEVILSGDTPAVRAMIAMLGKEIRASSGGNVQVALGGHA